MSDKDFAKIGSPETHGGMFYIVHNMDGIIKAQIDLCKTVLELQCIEVTPDIEREIENHYVTEGKKYDLETKSKGIPEKFQTLFNIKKKSKAINYARQMTITDDEFFLLIYNCSQIGFRHQLKTKEFLPTHLEQAAEEIPSLIKNDKRKFIGVVHEIFQQRRRIHAHLFENDKEWHCFYFSFKDMENENPNHWKYGSHIHYVSHLWPNVDKNKLWDSFDKRTISIDGALHIKFTESAED